MAPRAPGKSPPTATQLFVEEHLRGRLPLVAVGGLALALVILYFTDLLPERVAGALLAGVVLLGACALAAASLLPSTRSRMATGAAAAGLIALAVIVGWPLLADLFPGTPVAHLAAARTGDAVPVPIRGPVRVLAESSGAGGALFACAPRLAIGKQTAELDFHRQQQAVRVGRRGRGTTVQDHLSSYVRGDLTGAGDRVAVIGGADSPTCAFALNVFPDRIPIGLETVLAGGLVILLAGVAARSGAGAVPAAAAGAAAAFGLIAVGGLTPDTAVRPAFGAMLGGLPAGGIVGLLLSLLLARLLAPPPPARVPTRRSPA